MSTWGTLRVPPRFLPVDVKESGGPRPRPGTSAPPETRIPIWSEAVGPSSGSHSTEPVLDTSPTTWAPKARHRRRTSEGSTDPPYLPFPVVDAGRRGSRSGSEQVDPTKAPQDSRSKPRSSGRA